jgi:NAD(P)-dependent dehydrogenase (short-subunit alcohol dehydrogenase family)
MKPAQLFDMSGTVAIVTGASGTLGRQFSLALADAGAAVALVGRRRNELEETQRDVSKTGAKSAVIETDLVLPGAIAGMLSETERALGVPTLLVNNAGAANVRATAELTAQEWDHVMNVNLRAAFLAAQGFGQRRIAAGGGGAIVNIASITGLTAPMAITPYAISKGAMIQLTKILAREWARHRIRVNALCPGYFESNMTQRYLSSEGGERMLRAVPMRRGGQAGELDGPLLLLASDAGGYMTGATIVVDGGQTLVTP